MPRRLDLEWLRHHWLSSAGSSPVAVQDEGQSSSSSSSSVIWITAASPGAEPQPFLVRRGSRLGSQMLAADLQLLEHEFRLHTELIPLMLTEFEGVLRSKEATRALANTEPNVFGRMDVAVYEVLYPGLSARSKPFGGATPLCMVRRGTKVRGFAFEAEGGPWLQLDYHSREQMDLNPSHSLSTDAFLPIAGRSAGMPNYLRRVPGKAGPLASDWRDPEAAASAAAGKLPTLTPTSKWSRFVRLLMLRPIRIPQCVAVSNWKGCWQDMCMVLEHFAPPEWQGIVGDPRLGVSEDCATDVVEAMGKFHAEFSWHRARLPGNPWLPKSPLPCAAQFQDQYVNCFRALERVLSEVLPEACFEACRALCDELKDVATPLAQGPETLLHGAFFPDRVRCRGAHTALLDWRFVCLGPGVFDFACFLGLCAPPVARRGFEGRLIEHYLKSSKQKTFDLKVEKGWSAMIEAFRESVQAALPKFEADLRSALLVALAFYIVLHAGALEAGSEQACRGLRWLGETVDDWDAECLVGLDLAETKEAKPNVRRGKARTQRRSSSGSSARSSRSPSPKPRAKSPGSPGGRKDEAKRPRSTSEKGEKADKSEKPEKASEKKKSRPKGAAKGKVKFGK